MTQSKIRLFKEDDEIPRYPLTISANGRIISSTTNEGRAALFGEDDCLMAQAYYSKEDRLDDVKFVEVIND